MPLLDILIDKTKAIPGVELSTLISLAAGISKTEANRLLKQKAVKLYEVGEPVDNRYVWGPPITLEDNGIIGCTEDDLYGLKIGKRKFFLFSQVIGEILITQLQT